MNKQIEQLKDEADYSEATIKQLLESCHDWLESEIKESEEEFVRGVIKKIVARHPSLAYVIDSLEF